MDLGETREVRFDKWCGKCKHKETEEVKSPCHECLDEPVNQYSTKPLQYEEGDLK